MCVCNWFQRVPARNLPWHVAHSGPDNFLWPLCKCIHSMDWWSDYFWCCEPRWSSPKNSCDLQCVVHLKQHLHVFSTFGLFGLSFFGDYFWNVRAWNLLWGIPNSSRARALLFLSKTLQPKQSAYPSIGQKKLNGASSRMMIYFAMELANRINRDHPSDVNRCWGPIFKGWKFTHILYIYIYIFININIYIYT